MGHMFMNVVVQILFGDLLVQVVFTTHLDPSHLNAVKTVARHAPGELCCCSL